MIFKTKTKAQNQINSSRENKETKTNRKLSRKPSRKPSRKLKRCQILLLNTLEQFSEVKKKNNRYTNI